MALKRAVFLEYLSNRTSCLIGLEACGGSQHCARALTRLGHTVKLLPPRFVKAFSIGNKNDAADARAMCHALTQGRARGQQFDAQRLLEERLAAMVSMASKSLLPCTSRPR